MNPQSRLQGRSRHTRSLILLGLFMLAGAAYAQTVAPPTPTAATAPSDAPAAPAPAAAVDVNAPPASPGAMPPATALPPPATAANPTLSQLQHGKVDQDAQGRLMCAVGCLAMIGLAWLLSEQKRRVDWKLVAMGTMLQLIFAVIILKTTVGRLVFEKANDGINDLLAFSDQGARFIFGNLVDLSVPVGHPLFEPGAASLVLQPIFWANTGAMIAFKVLPTILFFSALMALLYHTGIMQVAVRGIAWVMQRTMKTSGAETASVASNIFLGQTEAPLLVKPFLDKMTRSELMSVMAAGFATVAGGVMAAYVGMLQATFPDIAGHLLAESVMGAPAAMVMAKIMIPETEVPETAAGTYVPMDKIDSNLVDAVARGTSEGLTLALNVAAMLITFIAIIGMINAGLGGIGHWFGVQNFTLERLFGWVGAPLAFLLGVPWSDAPTIGALIGTKTVVNEFVAYQQLAVLLQEGKIHEAKSAIIASYALCGFSNFGSIGIQIGGIAAMAPSRRSDVAKLGLAAMVCGSLATFQTAAIAGLFL